MTSQKPKIFARIVAGCVFLVSMAVLLGWTFDLAALKSLVPGWPTVAPLTMLAFLLAAFSLWCATLTEPSPPTSDAKQVPQLAAPISAVMVALIGLSRLGDHAFSWNLNVDLLGFREILVLGGSPARMALATSLEFLLIGGALFFARKSRSFVVFQLLVLACGLLGWLGLSRYIYGGEPLLPYAQMSVLTALCFLPLSAGVFCLRTDGGLLALTLSDSVGGRLVRLLLPPAAVLTFAIGWLRLKAQAAGWFGTEVGVSVSALFYVMTFVALVWVTAVLLNRAALKQQQASDAMRENEARLVKVFLSCPVCVTIHRWSDQKFVDINPAFTDLTGFKPEDVLGRTTSELGIVKPEEALRIRSRLGNLPTLRDAEIIIQTKSGDPRNIIFGTQIVELRGELHAISTFIDVTERKRTDQALRESEEHFHFLNDLGEATRALADPEQIMAVTARMLGEHLRVSRCAYADVEDDGERFTILHDYTDGCVSTVGNYQLSLFGARAVTTLNSGLTLIIRNVETELLPGDGVDMFNAIGIKAIITCPLVKGGVLRAMMAVHQATPRNWTPGEIAMVQEVVERCWSTIERRTAENNLYQREALLRIAGRTARLGGWTVTLPEIRITWSDEVCAIHDMPVGTVPEIEQALNFYVPQSRETLNIAFRACIQQGTPFDLELQVMTAKGRPIWIRSIGEAQRNAAGVITRVQGAFQEITERKQVEEEIHRLNLDLEQRVVERTAQLEAANKELEAFSYSISHDLRAPLRAVDGYSQAVREDFGPLLPADGQRQLRVISESAQRMGELIDDLLSFSRLSRQPLNKQMVKIDSLVRATLAEMTNQIEGREIKIEVSELPPCEGDPALLKQVWVNLLSNALKYSRKREHATLEIGCIEQHGEKVYFVRDNGSGFDMRYADKLFGVFQRLHRAEDYEGTGVGLAIVQRIVQRHGGRVWAEAAVDRGATFYFSLQGETTS